MAFGSIDVYTFDPNVHCGGDFLELELSKVLSPETTHGLSGGCLFYALGPERAFASPWSSSHFCIEIMSDKMTIKFTGQYGGLQQHDGRMDR